MASLLQRLRSARHGFWYAVSERIGWSRGLHRETPAGTMPDLPFEQIQRIAVLRSRYGVKFEATLSAATSVNCYEYLDILDATWAQSALAYPRGGVICDVGCSSFWYAAVHQAFFQPQQLVGFDVEGHRLFKDGRTRTDYARGYLVDLPGARFVVADYAAVDLPADCVTAWFPFLTPAAILAWRLPLSLLQPERLLRRIYHNLKPGGRFFMVNHGPEEGKLALALCDAVGFVRLATCEHQGVLSLHRLRPAVASCWGRP